MQLNPDWTIPRVPPRLSEKEVHVWCASIEASNERRLQFMETFSDDEHKRLQRFHFERHRHQFIIARGTLREIIGQYLEIEPAEANFDYGQNGKPFIISNSELSSIRFNISHSGDVVVYAFVLDTEIGIDIEKVCNIDDCMAIAKSFFSSTEIDDLQKVSRESLLEAFYSCWTRKEAYIKAKGQGLGIPLNQFSVSVRPDLSPALVSTEFAPDEAAQWTLRDLPIIEGYIGAIAIQKPDNTFRFYKRD